MSDQLGHVTLPSPLPWRLTFTAAIESFDGYTVALKASVGQLTPPGVASWSGSCSIETMVLPGGDAPTIGQPVRVELKPIGGGA